MLEASRLLAHNLQWICRGDLRFGHGRAKVRPPAHPKRVWNESNKGKIPKSCRLFGSDHAKKQRDRDRERFILKRS